MDAAPKHTFVHLNRESSVYCEVCSILSRRSGWRREFGMPRSCALTLAAHHGKKVPFAKLGGGQLVNYLPASNALCHKDHLVAALRAARRRRDAPERGKENARDAGGGDAWLAVRRPALGSRPDYTTPVQPEWCPAKPESA